MDAGTYMVHPLSSSFLPSGEREWIAGPNPSERVDCATGISTSSFLTFSGKSVRQFDSSIAGPSSDEGWTADGEWPNLQVERYRPACETLGALSLVAGGFNNQWELLKSVEIIFLKSKSLGKAKDMLKPREHFNLIALGSTLLALGGFKETSIEIWEGEGEPWKETSISLETSRSNFSALTSTNLVCSDGPLPPHSCPTVDGGTCVFPFTNGKLHSKLAKLIFPSGSETYSSCVSEDNKSFWCSTTPNKWNQCNSSMCPLEGLEGSTATYYENLIYHICYPVQILHYFLVLLS